MHKDAMNKPAEAKRPENPGPTMPTTFTGSEACVIRRSIFRRAEMGFLDTFSERLRGRRNDRDEGSERKDSVYLATSQERTREVYWTMMTSTLMASPLTRNRVNMVKVGLLVRNIVTREM